VRTASRATAAAAATPAAAVRPAVEPRDWTSEVTWDVVDVGRYVAGGKRVIWVNNLHADHHVMFSLP
jgi:hypothetical protein